MVAVVAGVVVQDGGVDGVAALGRGMEMAILAWVVAVIARGRIVRRMKGFPGLVPWQHWFISERIQLCHTGPLLTSVYAFLRPGCNP